MAKTRDRSGILWELLCTLVELAPKMRGWATVLGRRDGGTTICSGIMVAKFRMKGHLHCLFLLNFVPPRSNGLRFCLAKSVDVENNATVEFPIVTKYVINESREFIDIGPLYDHLCHNTHAVKLGVAHIQKMQHKAWAAEALVSYELSDKFFYPEYKDSWDSIIPD